eukprot:scaffold14401_cov140-Cylindrotheca_fusiformis.AAC.1
MAWPSTWASTGIAEGGRVVVVSAARISNFGFLLRLPSVQVGQRGGVSADLGCVGGCGDNQGRHDVRAFARCECYPRLALPEMARGWMCGRLYTVKREDLRLGYLGKIEDSVHEARKSRTDDSRHVEGRCGRDVIGSWRIGVGRPVQSAPSRC